jgi:glycosyltransferase involved in cell wall biosynthesis
MYIKYGVIAFLVIGVVFLVFFLFWRSGTIDYWNHKQEREKPRKYYASVLTQVKDEGMVIEEFIQHHLEQGIDHLYVIDNGSTDNTSEVLSKYAQQGVVSVINRPKKRSQKKNLRQVYNQIRFDTKWLLVVDADEYVFGVQKKLVDVLRDLQANNTNYIDISWTMFGGNGYEKQPNGIREHFVKRWPNNPDGMGKSVFQTDFVFLCGVHKSYYNWRKTNKLVLPENSDLIRIHHYCIMSKEYFQKVKMSRGDAIMRKNPRDWNYYQGYDSPAIVEDTVLCDIATNGYTEENNK